jgi:eukaryotic-like serine/threonine-protein kinase
MSEGNIHCTACQEEIAVGDSFCPYCGAKNEVIGSEKSADNLSNSNPEPSAEKDGNGLGATSAIGAARTSATKLKPLPEGTVLANRYEILKRIGGGGMGAVYMATDRNLGGAVRAVKEMVQAFIEGDRQEKAIEDFKRESLLLSSLDHVSIPTIYDYFFDEIEHRFYLVMKYIPGGDLATRLRTSQEGRLDEEIVLDWAIQLTEVLEYLHGQSPSIVYRDLKPANVMVDGKSGRAMLIDFGIARWVQGQQTGVTAVGTMGYAPPELFSGNVDPRSDIYSLGATLFHLLTGADPQANPLLIFDFKKNPRPKQINTALSSEMDGIITRAVEYDAAHRFQTVSEMGRALRVLKEKKLEVQRPVAMPRPAKAEERKDTVFCGFCGRKIFVSDFFCPFCGARQKQSGGTTSSIGKRVFGSSVMVVDSNGEELLRFEIEKPSNLIGRRDPSSNIFPEIDLTRFDPLVKISRRHARLVVGDGGWKIVDNDSANGTFLLREDAPPKRLLPGQFEVLQNGDDIRLGDVTLRILM